MEPNAPAPDSSGRLARLAGESFEAIYHKLAPHRQAARDEALTLWLDGHEADATALVRDLLGDIATHPETPDAARPIFQLMTAPEHATTAILTVLGVYPIISAFIMAAVTPFVTDIANRAWRDHPSAPLSPSEVALAEIRNVPLPWDGAAEAAQSGIDADRYKVLKLITGDAPAPQALMEAWRRGIIERPDFEKGLRQGRLRNEWIDTMAQLRFTPPSPLEAIAGAVKGHLDKETAKGIAEEGGLAPLHFDWVLATAGRPPGTVEMLQLLNRGLIDEATFGDAVRQSDVQDRWIPQLIEMKRYIPPVRSIVSMIRHSALTDDQAREILKWHGVTPDDQEIYLREGHADRTVSIKHLALGEVSKLYDARMIDRAQASLDVQALGYDTTEADLILSLVDSAKERKYLEAGITRIHTLLVNHRITQTEASADFDRLKIDPAERDALLRLWLIEAESNVKILTLAQIQGAWRRKVMSNADAKARLLELGYHAADVPHLLALALPPNMYPSRIPEEASA